MYLLTYLVISMSQFTVFSMLANARNNTAMAGGGIAVDSGDVVTLVTIDSSDFSGNIANTNGGAVSAGGNIIINGSFFDDNSAPQGACER